jgi:predicted membrane protein
MLIRRLKQCSAMEMQQDLTKRKAMTTEEFKQSNFEHHFHEWEGNSKRGRIYGGLMLLVFGVLFLLHQLGYYMPDWFFTWQMFLISLGLYIGLKYRFRRFSWIIITSLGIIFMFNEYASWFTLGDLLWPLAIICAGLFLLLKPGRSRVERWVKWREKHKFWEAQNPLTSDIQSGDQVEINSVFSSVKKNVVSKNFRGGEINVVFAGCELNMQQADLAGRTELEINQVFGSTQLIIPQHWTIQSDITAVMGSVEDKRPLTPAENGEIEKVLVLRGTAIFGGIEITSVV